MGNDETVSGEGGLEEWRQSRDPRPGQRPVCDSRTRSTKGDLREGQRHRLETIPLFIKSKFGEQGFKRWLDSRTPLSREIFRLNILASARYPLQEALIDPTLSIASSSTGAGWTGPLNRGDSAQNMAKGVHRLFVRLAAPPARKHWYERQAR